MNNSQQFSQMEDAYTEAFTNIYGQDEAYEVLSLGIDDTQLDRMLISALESDRAHWNKRPWVLEKTDVENTAFLLGQQLNDRDFLRGDSKYVDNRLFSSVRAILSYATGQLAKPDITPSRGDEIYLKGARDIGAALYQHSMDENVDAKVRSAVLNLISRKRGFLKLRWDPHAGLDGDVITEVCNPEDIVISRSARYLENPDRIYHRITCTIDDLCNRYPGKREEILAAYGIQRGVHTQMSRLINYFECWFTHPGKEGPEEGVCWFIPEKKLILDKMKNPNWVYMKSRKKEKEANVTSMPPKPFVGFNYINMGNSYIDETCLVEQAKPMQEMLNKRGRQIWENADYVNGRWVASKKAFSQEDAQKIVNKGAKTVALVDSEDVNRSFANVASAPLPSYVENTLYDARNEIDGLMGTPSQFKGAAPDSKDTLGRDLMIKQQAGALQDDLVRALNTSMAEYYKIKLQLMRVNYTEDHWFQTKGGDGKYEFILLNGDALDTNVKVGVEIDSTLPLDKASIRATAMELWNAGNAIDYRTLMEDLGLPNPEVRTERYLKSHADPINYLRSVELSSINTDAEADIQLLIADKTPEERDDYSEDYFNYFNKVISSNRFQKLMGDKPEAAQRITMFLAAIQHTMMQSLNMQESLTDAGMLPSQPPQPEMPPQPDGASAPLPIPSAEEQSGIPAADASPPVPTQ